jgi:hypothetical protein
MFDRTQRVRQREQLFFETLDQHYAQFFRDATSSYDSWREYAREEAIAIRELTRSTRWRTGMGVATIVASLVSGSNSGNDSFSDRVIRDAMMYVGMDMLRTSAVRRQEKKLHSDTLEELSSSFDDDIEPMIVEIQGTQHRLTGTAEIQYQEWRDLLRQMFIAETGFVPEEVAIYSEPEPQLPPELETLPVEAAPAAEGEAVVEQPESASEAPTEAGDVVEPAESSSEAPAEAVTDASSSFRTGA